MSLLFQFLCIAAAGAMLYSRWHDEHREKLFEDAGAVILIGTLGTHIATWVIGWIVRGFLGIPAGHDRRPNSPEVSCPSAPKTSVMPARPPA